MHWWSEWGCSEQIDSNISNHDCDERPSKFSKTRSQVSKTHFVSSVLPGRMEEICKSSQHKESNTWVVHAFEKWQEEQSENRCGEKRPVDLLQKTSWRH